MQWFLKKDVFILWTLSATGIRHCVFVYNCSPGCDRFNRNLLA
jgi:hypothetical protein